MIDPAQQLDAFASHLSDIYFGRNSVSGTLLPYSDILKRGAGACEKTGPATSDLAGRLRRLAATVDQGKSLMIRDVLDAVEDAAAALSAQPKPPMKIAYVLWQFPSLTETFIVNELRELLAKDHDVIIFCRTRTPEAVSMPIPYEIIESFQHLATRLRETERQVVHSHFIYPTVTELVWPACEMSGVPFTFIPHGQDIFRYANDQVNRMGEVVSSRQCKAVFAASRFHARFIQERNAPPHKIILNPNGIDPSLYEYREPKRPVSRSRAVCAIHRYVAKKGLTNLIAAAKLLEDDGVTVNLFGFGMLEAEYKAQIEAADIKNVTVGGPVRDRDHMLEIFRSHDLFACPSIRADDGDMDGVPTVLMEAMAVGLPVFATTVSGIPDLIEDSVTGFTCEATADSIAGCIRRFYATSYAGIRQMARRGRQCIDQKYNTVQLTRDLLRVWRPDVLLN